MSLSRPASLGLIAILFGSVLFSGCPSFENSVKPLITTDSTTGDSAGGRTYMTGTRDIGQTDPSSLRLDIWRIATESFPDSVRIFARVYTTDGKLVEGLAPPYYTGREDYHTVWNALAEQMGEDGRATPITDFTVREFSDRDGVPFEIALSLDYSGSMGSNITSLENAAAGFVQMKHQQDRIALVKFSDKVRLISAPTTSKEELLGKFGTGLSGFGRYTALYSAMKLGADQVAGAPEDHPRALILFTDGEDNASTITSAELCSYCVKNSIPVFAIAFGVVNREVLSGIAAKTGGRYYQTSSPSEFAAVFQDIYLSLHNYYLISYRPLPYGGTHVVHIGLKPQGSPVQPSATGSYTVAGTDQKIVDRLIDLGKLSLYFEYNKATLKPESQGVIDSVIQALRANPRIIIEVHGHTSSEGTKQHNDSLSLERAKIVQAEIIRGGIAENRVGIRGFGFDMPIANNDTEEGRQKNRRANFVVIRQ